MKILNFCWKTLHLYGKKAEDFEVIVDMYLGFLGGYPAKDVVKAFERYVKSREQFPTPSAIIGIIEGRIARDSKYYETLLKKRANSFLTDPEEDYLRRYERQVLEDFN